MKKNKFTTVTANNMAKVMGDINRFFQKPTRRYDGLKMHQVGTELQDFGDFKCNVPVYEERETYTPFVGKCTVHWRRKDVEEKIKNKKWVSRNDIYAAKRLLLSISDNYSNNCLPIYTGFGIFISGDCMIIRQNDIYFENIGFNGKVFRMKNKDKSTYTYFYHMPISEEELQEKVRDGIYAMLDNADQVYYCVDSECSSYPEYIQHDIRSIHMDLVDAISDAIQRMDLSQSEAIVPVRFDYQLYTESQKEVNLHVNIDSLRNGISSASDKSLFFTYGDDVSNEVYDLITAHILREEIDEYFKRCEEDDSCDDCDFDYGDYDYDFD